MRNSRLLVISVAAIMILLSSWGSVLALQDSPPSTDSAQEHESGIVFTGTVSDAEFGAFEENANNMARVDGN